MYGSQRLGYFEDEVFMGRKCIGKWCNVLTPVLPMFPSTLSNSVGVMFGKKRYELGDWLGNVRVVINDRKTPINIGSATVGYKAQVVNVNDYYSYGSTINERTYDYSSTKFRFAFNGKELDNEVYGFGNFQDYGARMYNTRLGRFISPDPLIVGQKKYAWLSGYQFASNRPIDGIDMDGLESVLYYINFEGERIGTSKVELKNAGPLGNGVAIKTNKGGTITYFYGNEIPNSSGELFTKSYEGKELKSYKDIYGNLTAGYGHLLSKEEQRKYPEGTEITEEQASAWFASDYSNIKLSVLKNKIKDADLTITQKDAIVDFYFNIGPNHKSDIINSEKGGDFFLGYMKGGAGIWKRRFAEKLLFEEGKYLKIELIKDKNTIDIIEKLYKDNFPNKSDSKDIERKDKQ